MSDEVQSKSYTQSTLVYYNTSTESPGIYIEWERYNLTGVGYYKILRSEYFDGTYETIDTVIYPSNEYVDRTGKPSYYYKIQEVNTAGTSVLSTSTPISGDELLTKSSIRFELEHLLNVPIYDEELIFHKNRTAASVAFPHWNYLPRPELRITGLSDEGDRDSMITLSEYDAIYKTINPSYNPIVYGKDGVKEEYTSGNNYNDGLRAKYDYKGNIYFINNNNDPISIHSYDTIFASYTVKMFASEHINSALYMSLQTINSQPGASKYSTVSGAPYYYEPAIVFGACYFLLRNLITSLTQRQRRLLLEDPDSKIVEDLRQAATMYKEQYDELLKKLPIARLPNTRGIVVPEFNMPGGRSRFFRYIWNLGTAV